MQVTAWASGGGTFGLRIGKANRDRYFERAWDRVVVEFEGKPSELQITSGFWRACPEIRGKAVAEFFQKRGLISWPKGNPPSFELVPLAEKHFRLL
jgi:hypothetical protein